MVGMIQILTYLLCVYLVFKGLEIVMIALASARADRAGLVTIAVLLFLVSVGAAFFFWHAADQQASAVSSRIQNQ